jgi:biotin transport system substrate-specific component
MSAVVAEPRVLADVVGHSRSKDVALVFGGAALVGVSAQVAFFLPWNPAVPVTLQTFAVVLAAAALGPARGVGAMLVYAMAGGAGGPWFAQASAGFSAPSFGYILGFIVAAFVVGWFAERGATRTFWRSVGLMIAGNAVIYGVGASWLKYQLALPWMGVDSAWSYGVRDFLLGDVLKTAAAAALLPLTWKALKKAGLDTQSAGT